MATQTIRTLLVETDPGLRESVARGLQRWGHVVRAVGTGQEGLAELRSFGPDLILVDLMLSDITGIQVCRRVQEVSTVPVIMLSSRGDDFDVIVGLEAGADDYIVKPASAEVINARIRTVLRRSKLPHKRVLMGDLTIDPEALTVSQNLQSVDLAPSELKLLLFLCGAPERVFSREQLLERIWEDGFARNIRLVDACVKRLRQKLGDDAANPRYVQTVRNFGYRFGPL
ncbi:response regulator transcription factor [Streptomyces sp. NPDC093224]|uniref:response regulator transcription factor n=1 Tax=Streptomyces sp. NPDC093224 TaxID=3155198 RepID=UPI00342E3BDB